MSSDLSGDLEDEASDALVVMSRWAAVFGVGISPRGGLRVDVDGVATAKGVVVGTLDGLERAAVVVNGCFCTAVDVPVFLVNAVD